VIYFDSAYIAKCYLNEPGAERVRDLASGVQGISSCELARLELTCAVKRHLREGRLSESEVQDVFADFAEDEANGVWRWLPLTPELMRNVCERVKTGAAGTYLRACDAIHLGCAQEHGFDEVYTNDRHMLGATAAFGLRGTDVIGVR
jgi:predicted nucleic acid-binding protein